LTLTLGFVVLAGCASQAVRAPGASGASQEITSYTVIPGTLELDKGPDGNSVFLDAPDGLILVDTGRHPAHRDRLLAHAKERGRAIVAIVNTHWHLDHSTGNADIRAAYPQAEVYTSTAIEGALATFLRDSRERTQARLDAGEVPPEREPIARRFLAVMNNPDSLRPTRPITESADVVVAGRRLRVNLARFAATEGDVWIHDAAAGLVIAGDLVVAPVPFMDTACTEGWRRALEELAAVPFTTLIPGHGDPMSREDFLAWKSAFESFVDCGASERDRAECVATWRRDAAPFIPSGMESVIDEAAGYYIDTRLRSEPEERDRYCRPLGSK
jgi:glyoxylase-like metal-dependent hydrolase (beta-lactamase superfamily II)